MNILKLNINGMIVKFGISQCSIEGGYWGKSFPVKEFNSPELKNYILIQYNSNNKIVYLIRQSKDRETASVQQLNDCEELLNEPITSFVDYQGERFWRFCSYSAVGLLLDENETIRYPFGCFPINQLIEAFLGGYVINSSPIDYAYVCKDEILTDMSLMQKVSQEAQVDIKYIEGFVSYNYGRSSTIGIVDISKFVNNMASEVYSGCFECIKAGVAEAYKWAIYTPSTAKRKIKKMKELLQESGELPEYVKQICASTFSQDSNTYIVTLYNLGFCEKDFKEFERIFKSYSTLNTKRYMMVYDLVQNFSSDNKYDHFTLLQAIKINMKKNHYSMSTFFTGFQKLINQNDAGLSQDIFNAFINGDLSEVRFSELETLAHHIHFKKICDMLGQYPECSFSNDMFTRITSTDQMSDDFKSFFNKCFETERPDRWWVPTDTKIIFEINDCLSDCPFMYAMVDLRKQTYAIFTEDNNSRYRTLHPYVIYDSEDCVDFRSVNLDVLPIVKELNSFLTEYIYPVYLAGKIESIF